MIRFDVRSVSYGSLRRPGVFLPHVGMATFSAGIEAEGLIVNMGTLDLVWGCNDDGSWGPVHEIRLVPAPGLSGTLLAHSLSSGRAEKETIPRLIELAIAYWQWMTEQLLDKSRPAAEAVLRVG